MALVVETIKEVRLHIDASIYVSKIRDGLGACLSEEQELQIGPYVFKLEIRITGTSDGISKIEVRFIQDARIEKATFHSLQMVARFPSIPDLQVTDEKASAHWLLVKSFSAQQALQIGFMRRNSNGHYLVFQWRVRVPDDSSLASCNEAANAALATNLGALLSSGDFSDVVLAVKGEKLLAHSPILAAHSPVFAAALTHEMREKQSKQVDLSEFDVGTVRKMLRFLYMGKWDSPGGQESERDEQNLAVLDIAHRYQVQILVEHCVRHLSSTLSIQNVAEILMKADLLGIQSLKAECVDFMVAKHGSMSKVRQSEGFKILVEKRPHLVLDVLEAAFPNTAEDSLEQAPKARRIG
eukprot:TRINITY_DN6969_c1_g2_i1.p1 TRINITY_DN6969_c1_g2~~TRINITY_DN6969_c1_g2_i1.p1  ORF type:complete len:353 (-),score=65.53 TRINITY_DN6969_c1_g2_i1:290-1348(-)